jgi:hypothetical protein
LLLLLLLLLLPDGLWRVFATTMTRRMERVMGNFEDEEEEG